MSNDINLKEKPDLSAADDLTLKAARFGGFGWFVAAILLIVLVVQNLILAIAPKPTLATQDGVVIGQVVFDEARIRNNDEVLADIKKWVAKCTSVNKLTIYEDLAICLNHLEPQLAQKRLADMEKNLYATRIEKYGCKNTEIVFNDKKTIFKREPLDYLAEATLVGEVQCITPNNEPVTQAFKIHAIAKLTERTSNLPLALKVTDTWDVVE